MFSDRIQVGRRDIALLAAMYGMGPGAVLSVDSDPAGPVLTLQVVERAPVQIRDESTACAREP